jgi:hypothetical protein
MSIWRARTITGFLMPILYGAVAYKENAQGVETEMQSWDLARRADVVGCPAGCPVLYDLYTEINASEGQVHEYIELIHERLQRECPQHAERIRINPAG